MITSTHQAAYGWSDHLLREMGQLQASAETLGPVLQEESRDDLEHLLDAGTRLGRVLDSANDTHELMNVLTAIRGYAEMLQDGVREEHPALGDSLATILELVQAAAGNGPEARPTPSRDILSDPGFILAVDDRQENRELVARNLGRLGHFVITAGSGEEALHALEQSDVDVVLLDLLMPGMDGREVLHKIKEHPEWRATPVIVISGSQDMDGIIECIEAGADDYLFKPFNPVLLQARIKAGIERKRWHDKEEQYRLQLERNEKFIRATFGRYLTDEIVTQILERPEGLELGGDLRRVSIMLSDIRGFTTLSEHLAPAQVVTLLNRYLGAMTDIIMKYHGTIDEFIGDAILAVFGAPLQRDDDADRAVQCALEMQAAMKAINAQNEAEGLPIIESGIAINTGDVIAGNIGSEKRSKYGFVGHPMNVASRIEDVTAGGQIHISDSTLLSLKGDYTVGNSQDIAVKGIDEIIKIHEIRSPEDK
jgi:class 3 adenylate cyclase/CheY-like chemotaxis protein